MDVLDLTDEPAPVVMEDDEVCELVSLCLTRKSGLLVVTIL